MIKKSPLALLALSVVTGVVILSISNVLFSAFHLKGILNTVEATEDILNRFNRNLQVNKTSEGCFKSKPSDLTWSGSETLGREYCGVEGVNSWLAERVKPTAKVTRSELAVEKYFFEKRNVAPFGDEFNDPIAAYDGHLEAWGEYLLRLSNCTDAFCLNEELSKSNEITSSFGIAEREFNSVKAKFDFLGSSDRIDKIFKD